MSGVQIACFTQPEEAELAADFLRRHGIKATIPVSYFPGRYAPSPTRVLVKESQADAATALLRRVLAGEFADADPDDRTAEGLGAALAEAVLPAPGYRPPTWLEALGPLLFIVAFGILALVGGVIYGLVKTGGQP